MQAGAKTIGLVFLYQVSAEGWLRKLNLPDSDISRSYDSPLAARFAAGSDAPGQLARTPSQTTRT